MVLVQLSAGFQSLLSLPTRKLGPSGADSQVGGFVYILGPRGSVQQTLLWCWSLSHHSNPHIFLQSEVLGLYFPTLEPWITWSVLLPSCSSQFIHTQMWDRLVLQPPPCRASSPPQLPISTPPTSLDECFFFNSLVVRFPYSSIFWQFWLFFVFKFIVVLLWVVQGGKVYLPTPPSWPKVYLLIFPRFMFQKILPNLFLL